jgi:hypothetical protein
MRGGAQRTCRACGGAVPELLRRCGTCGTIVAGQPDAARAAVATPPAAAGGLRGVARAAHAVGLVSLAIAALAWGLGAQDSRYERRPFRCAAAEAVAVETPDSARGRAVREMLARVAELRGLTPKRRIHTRSLRPEVISECMRAAVKDAEQPEDVRWAEAELPVALELVPVDFDMIDELAKLLGDNVAGYYVPGTDGLVVRSDLRGSGPEGTLAHELMHALQDQSFPPAGALWRTIARPGEHDRRAALGMLIEGEAEAVGLEVELRDASALPEEELRKGRMASLGTSRSGRTMPHWLRASLAAPYTHGFAAVQRARKRGGWSAVDALWSCGIESTEQMLHDDKLATKEPPMAVPVPTLAPLGSSFRAVVHDTYGELALRLALAEWTAEEVAADAAAGWGGDTWVVAVRGPRGSRDRITALAWHIRLDGERDAAELAGVLGGFFGTSCRERPDLGPIHWRRGGVDVVLVAGPYERRGRALRSAGSCETAEGWARAILAQR